MHYPLSGLIEGFDITFNNSGKGYDDSDSTKLDVTVSGGEVILDSERITLSSDLTIELATDDDLSSTETTKELWLNPLRYFPVFTGNPPDPATIDFYTLDKKPERKPQSIKVALKVVDYEDYQLLEQAYYAVDNSDNMWDTGGNWEALNEIRKVPWVRGPQNQYRFNPVKPEVTVDSFALENEKQVYYKTNLPPYITQPQNSELRNPGGFRLATIYYPGDGSNAEIQEGVDFNDLIQIP
jgi:hypothetical protein